MFMTVFLLGLNGRDHCCSQRKAEVDCDSLKQKTDCPFHTQN